MISETLLKSIHLFSNLSGSLLKTVSKEAELKTYAVGEWLYQENQKIHHLYILLSGQLESYVYSHQGQKRVLEIISPVDTLGEAEILSDQIASCTVSCVYPARVIKIPKKLFELLWKKSPNFTKKIVHLMALNQVRVNRNLSDESICQWVALVMNKQDLVHAEAIVKYLHKHLRFATLCVHAHEIHSVEKITRQAKKYRCVIILHTPEDLEQKIQHFDLCGKIINLSPSQVDGPFVENPILLKGNFSDPGYLQRIGRCCLNLTVGLALSSGTAHGLAHIGVLKTLFENHIPIDIIAGCSGGAVYSAPFALGIPAKQIEAHFSKILKKGVRPYLDPTLSLRGLMKGNRFLKNVLEPLIGSATFDDLKTPFFTVSTSLNSGQEVLHHQGKLMEAVRASMSIPAIFEPVIGFQKDLLVDGVVTTPVPVQALRKLGADIVIAVHVSDLDHYQPKKIPNLIEVFMRARAVTTDLLADAACMQADFVIKPPLKSIGSADYSKIDQIIQEGARSTQPILNPLKAIFGLGK